MAKIRDAFEDEYKDPAKQAAAEASHKARYGSEQVAEFAEGEDSARKNLAENSSVGPVEDVSEDFSQMKRQRRNN